MTVEQLVAVLGGFTALLGALALLVRQVGELRKDLNGRLEQLVQVAAMAAGKEGELVGRDFDRRRRQQDAPGSKDPGALTLEK